MNVSKIAIGKFVSSLRVLGKAGVDTEMPFCILSESVEADEFILFICRRLMSAPRAFTIRNDMSLFDESRGECEGIFI
jgi:hypothetical protein